MTELIRMTSSHYNTNLKFVFSPNDQSLLRLAVVAMLLHCVLITPVFAQRTIRQGVIRVDDQPGRNDSEKIENAMRTEVPNYTGIKTLQLSSRRYFFHRPLKIGKDFSIVSEGAGARSTEVIFYDVHNYPIVDGFRALLQLENRGDGRKFSGLNINAYALYNGQQVQVDNVIAIRASSLSSSEFDGIKINLQNLFGNNHIGISVEKKAILNNTESVVFRNIAVYAPIPFYIVSGDNLHFEDLDLTCTNGPVSGTFKSACVQYGPSSKPDHHIFDGSQTWQGGRHALYLNSNAKFRGSGLILRNVRYEQSMGTGDIPNESPVPAWVIKFENDSSNPVASEVSRATEVVTMDGCRHSENHQIAYELRNIMRVQINHNCRLNGRKSFINDAYNSAGQLIFEHDNTDQIAPLPNHPPF